ncbi:MAG: CBS domain-containing protein [Deltaproteobacteria bacterium]|nr:CBS domain-containing protein [Deltaproteobacteria bacterium]
MQAKDVMTRQVEAVRSDGTIQQAAAKMEELNVGVLPVIAGDEVVGMITDRDIVVRSVAQGLDPEKHKVMEAATEGVVSCNEEDEVSTVIQLMEDKQIRRVLVKSDGKVTGIISLGDLAVQIRQEKAGEALKEVSEPSEPDR